MSIRVRTWMFWSPLIFIGLLCLLIVPVSAAPTVLNVTLDKTYQYNDMDVHYLDFVDVTDPSVSKAWMLETISGDLKTIESPSVRYLNRSFTTEQATVRGVTVRVVDKAALEQPLSMAGMANTSVYTALHVPTPHLEVPGESGNPVIAKNNESYSKSSDHSSISALFNASKFLYLYAPHAVVHYDPSTQKMTQVGTFSGSITNIGQTLVSNEVSLPSFSANAGNSASMTGESECAPTEGKYAMTASQYVPSEDKIRVLASLPVVIMDGDRSLTWNGKTTPAAFAPGNASDVTLSFNNTAGVTDTAYLIVRKNATYDIAASVDVNTLATNAKDHWNSMGMSASITDLLVWGVNNEIGTGQPVTYSVTTVGGASPSPSTEWSDIAITPGYGCSGHAHGTSVAIPATELDTLGTGTYYVYAAELDANHDVIALDQKEVAVCSAPVANFTASPTSGYKPLSVTFTDTSVGTITSRNWTFGDGATSTSQNPTHIFTSAGTYTTTLKVVGPGGNSTKSATITVKSQGGGGSGGSSGPVATVTPVSGASGSSLYTTFSIPGLNVSANETNQTLSLDLSKATRTTVSDNTITILQNGLTYVITVSGISRDGNIVTGTITDVVLKSGDMTATFNKTGDAVVSFLAHLPYFPVGGRLSADLGNTPSDAVVSAYSLALRGEGLDVGDVAYTLTVSKTVINRTGAATITMAVDPAWVTAHGGVTAIRIVRQADNGTTEVLETTFKGYNADGQYVFEAQSPNGLSVIGLVAVTAASAETTMTTAPVSDTTTSAAPTTGATGEGGFPIIPTLVVLIIVIVLAVVGYRMSRKQ